MLKPSKGAIGFQKKVYLCMRDGSAVDGRVCAGRYSRHLALLLCCTSRCVCHVRHCCPTFGDVRSEVTGVPHILLFWAQDAEESKLREAWEEFNTLQAKVRIHVECEVVGHYITWSCVKPTT
jgi:hypothetical protein